MKDILCIIYVTVSLIFIVLYTLSSIALRVQSSYYKKMTLETTDLDQFEYDEWILNYREKHPIKMVLIDWLTINEDMVDTIDDVLCGLLPLTYAIFILFIVVDI